MIIADVVKQEQRSYVHVLDITIWIVTLHQNTLN